MKTCLICGNPCSRKYCSDKCRKIRQKQYYKEYMAKNKDKKQGYDKKWYEKNKEDKQKKSREYQRAKRRKKPRKFFSRNEVALILDTIMAFASDICGFCLTYKKEPCNEDDDCGHLLVQAVEKHLKIEARQEREEE